MSSDSALPLIEVSELKVGMFIQLDLSWMEHPFALSRFKLSSQDQIDAVVQLGLKQVRWDPARSAREVVAALQAEAALPLGADGSHPSHGSDQLADPLTQEELRDRKALDAQREALSLCEQQFVEVVQSHRSICDAAIAHPLVAGEQARKLAQALVSKIAGPRDLQIRLLTQAAGEAVSAHAVNVGVLALLMGRVFGWSPSDLVDLCLGAILHDIGKEALPKSLRVRDEAFNAKEMRAYQDHVAQGVAMGQRMGLPSAALLVIGQHHEMSDGSGYPMQVRAERLSAAARVVALLNHYDNLCNNPRNEQIYTPHEALSTLFTQGSEKFDTSILAAFIKMMGVYPPGSLVQLTDDRYAMVVGVNSSRPNRPKVLVHDPRMGWKSELIVDLEEVSGLGIRRSLKPRDVPAAALAFLAPRPRVAYFFDAMPEPATA
jgi:putative nucleotidyltransferase with HDIG domain